VFTGLVEGQGAVVALAPGPDGAGATLALSAPWITDGLAAGDSVAVNGCCLTVTSLSGDGFSADLVAETLARTALGRLAPGDLVNLERPLAVGDRLGGHLVQGHVDGLGRVLELRPAPDGTVMVVGVEEALARYLVAKGSVAVDGVSLTVAGVGPERFWVALIPHTLAVTTLGARGPGAEVQLEVDVVAKYVERLAMPYTQGVAP
jgi:riboflavin synthase